ncbi:MAG: hypothetical protein IPJ20_23820 [Flammeovirgaceae bacterium]|nr:hypothetical protein [Flammeovirgaceae bacterium]
MSGLIALGTDLGQVADQLISLSLVTDPFGSYNRQDLAKWFTDIANPYKEHFVVDLQAEDFVAAHHQRNAHKALRTVNVEICTGLLNYLDEWGYRQPD